MDRFFADDFAGRLIRDFPPFEQGCAVNESGELGRKATFENVRELGDTYQEADGLVRSPEFLALMSEISGIPDLLYDPAYIGGGTHKNRVGQDLDAHVDFNFHPTRGWHRRLNLIVYLNPEWEQEWGGSIEFHLDPWLPPDQNRVERVLPLANRAVLFETSERSWHGFEQVSPPPAREDLSRRSFAIYLYTVDRPPEETAPPHATVYVERPLPASVKPDAPISFQDADAVKSMLARRGRHIRRIFDRDQKFLSTAQRLVGKMIDDDAEAGLSAEQIDEVRWLLERQDQQLKFLYDRETGFTAAIERLRGLVKEEEARGGLVPLFGPVEQVTEPQGCWSDGWVTSPLQVRVAATEAVQRIRVQGALAPCHHGADSAHLAGGWRIDRGDGASGCVRADYGRGHHPGRGIRDRGVVESIGDAGASRDVRRSAGAGTEVDAGTVRDRPVEDAGAGRPTDLRSGVATR